MRLVVTMDYLAQDPKSGRYRYRRRVPQDLIKILGKREFSVSLKTTDQRIALERYRDVHHDVEAELAVARATDPADAEYRATVEALRKHRLLPPAAKSIAPVRFETNPAKFATFTEAALRAPDREFDRIVEAKFFGVQEEPLDEGGSGSRLAGAGGHFDKELASPALDLGTEGFDALELIWASGDGFVGVDVGQLTSY